MDLGTIAKNVMIGVYENDHAQFAKVPNVLSAQIILSMSYVSSFCRVCGRCGPIASSIIPNRVYIVNMQQSESCGHRSLCLQSVNVSCAFFDVLPPHPLVDRRLKAMFETLYASWITAEVRPANPNLSLPTSAFDG